MSLVLDSSVTIAWIMPNERTAAITGLVGRIAVDGAVVPSLWRLEVGNVLNLAMRRGRISLADRDSSLSDLLTWKIETDDQTEERAWADTLRLSDRHRLTLYDASYLELALRRGLPLATLDGDLIKAAAATGVQISA